MTEHYLGAAVCRSGHVRTARLSVGVASATVSSGPTRRLGEHCPKCGERVIHQCESCGSPILGRPASPALSRYDPPPFCDNCGEPHPWLDRQGRIDLLKKRLRADRELEPALRLKIEEQLEALRDPELTESEVARIAKRAQRLAPAFWETAGIRQIWTTLLTEYAKQKAGLADS